MGLGLGLTDQDFGFEKVTKVKDLLPVLKERLPNSCNVSELNYYLLMCMHLHSNFLLSICF